MEKPAFPKVAPRTRQRLQQAVWPWLAALLILSASAIAAQAQPKTDAIRFEVSVAPFDPFMDDHKIDAEPAAEIKAQRGEVVTVFIKGKIKDGYHTYPVEKVAPDQGDYRTSIVVKGPEGIVPLTGIRESEPILLFEKAIKKDINKHKHELTWEQDLLIDDLKPGTYKVPIELRLQVCDDKRCIISNTTLEVSIEVTDAEPLPVADHIKERFPTAVVAPELSGDSLKKEIATAPERSGQRVAGLLTGTTEEYRGQMDALGERFVFLGIRLHEQDTSLLTFLLMGVFFGAITLITPCVFPMIPITVSFFLKQSEKKNHNPVLTALVYCGTIVLVLTIAAVAFLGVFRALSLNPYMNLVIGGLFIFFALSLFGWYEIELPSGLAKLTSSREGQGGVIGTIFMALTFTIISFACVAPFLGAFGGILATGTQPFWQIVLGGLAFAVTFASPFFVLAMFPALLKKMPKSGSWLNSVKVIMGFVELAAAFKFLRMAELAGTSTATIFTYDLVLGIWVVLCILCGLYLLGVYRLPHDSPVEHIGVPRMLWAIVFLALGFYLMPGLFKDAQGQSNRPSGEIYAWVDSFILPDGSPAGAGKGKETANLPYAIAEAQKNVNRPGQPTRVFLDFTGVLCTNCKLNEDNVFTQPEIKQLFEQYIVVKLYTDKVPLDYYSPDVKADLNRQWADADANLQFQRNFFKDETLPLYAVLEPREDGKIDVLGIESGRIFQNAAFAQFLRDPGGNGGLADRRAQR